MTPSTPKLLTPHEIATILNISYASSLAFIKYSGIDYIQIGRQYRISEEKLQAFIAKKGKTVVSTN